MPPELAEQWIHAWEIEASDRGADRHSAAFWDGAAAWVSEQRSRKSLARD
jgi:hypothetical protein